MDNQTKIPIVCMIAGTAIGQAAAPFLKRVPCWRRPGHMLRVTAISFIAGMLISAVLINDSEV